MNNNNEVAGWRAWLNCWSVTSNFKALNQDSSGTFYLINGIRFFGFLWVLAAHTVMAYGIYNGKEAFFNRLENLPIYFWWFWGSDKAIDVFFVISGFLISLILIKELDKTKDINLKRFYLRRYLRLTPVYAVLAILFWWAGGRNGEYVWANLLYINNFLPPDKMPLQWTWSLAVEEQFYLLLPIILIAIHRYAKHSFFSVMLALLAVSVLVRLGVLYYYQELWNSGFRDMLVNEKVAPFFYGKLYDNLVTRYGPFVLGVMAGHAYHYHRDAIVDWVKTAPKQAMFLNYLAMALIVFFMYFPVGAEQLQDPNPWMRAFFVLHRTIFSVGIAWYLLSAVLKFDNFRVLSWFYSLRIWHPLGQLTYSMYLTHMLAVVTVMRQVNINLKAYEMAPMEHFYVSVALGSSISLVITLLLGVFCWVFIEKPFLNMRELMSVNRGATRASPEPLAQGNT